MIRRLVAAALALTAATALGGCCTPGPFGALFGCSDLRAIATTTKPTARVGEDVPVTGTPLTPQGDPYPTGDIDTMTVAWDFTDDGVTDYQRVLERNRNWSGPTLPEHHWSTIYTRAGVYSPAFTVVTSDLKRASARTSVRVNEPEPPPGENQRPVASFTGPDTAQAGQEVAFDGSASSDPDGHVALWEWDFDNDGSVELITNDGTGRWTYQTPGPRTVSLTVLDDKRARSDATTHSIYVYEGEPTGPGARAAAAARPFTATLRGHALGRAPPVRSRGTASRRRGVRGNGRITARLSPPRRPGDRALRGLLTARWRTRVNLGFDTRTLSARLTGIAVARPAKHRRRGERGCVSFKVTIPAFALPRGRLRPLGGTGRYARLRGGAKFTVAPRGRTLRLAGAATLRRARRRAPPSKCNL